MVLPYSAERICKWVNGRRDSSPKMLSGGFALKLSHISHAACQEMSPHYGWWVCPWFDSLLHYSSFILMYHHGSDLWAFYLCVSSRQLSSIQSYKLSAFRSRAGDANKDRACVTTVYPLHLQDQIIQGLVEYRKSPDTCRLVTYVLAQSALKSPGTYYRPKSHLQ